MFILFFLYNFCVLLYFFLVFFVCCCLDVIFIFLLSNIFFILLFLLFYFLFDESLDFSLFGLVVDNKKVVCLFFLMVLDLLFFGFVLFI